MAVQRERGNVKERAEGTTESPTPESLCVVGGLRASHKLYVGKNVRMERGKEEIITHGIHCTQDMYCLFGSF